MFLKGSCMSGSGKKSGDEYYVLTTGKQGEKRLNLLHSVYGPGTEKLLLDIGLRPGTKVADIGCGPGVVTCFMALHIGDEGLALGVDASADQLAVGREEAAMKGLKNVRFAQANVYELGLGADAFDLVYSRSLLSHLKNPQDALNEMAKLVRPGGVLVCEDIDMSSIFSTPASSEYKRMVEMLLALSRDRSTDYCVGVHMPGLFTRAGFNDLHVSSYQPVFNTGEKKRYWEYTLYELIPVLIRIGVTTQQEMDELSAGLARIGKDESFSVAQAVQTQVWARKP